MMPILDCWIEGYLDYQRTVRRLAPRSVVDIRCTLRRAVLMMGEIRPGVRLWEARLEDYLQWVNRKREAGFSIASINKELSHLRGLLDYTWRSGRCERNVLDGLRLEDPPRLRVPRHLSLEQARQLVAASGGGTRVERRERLILLLLYGCGLRTSELCQLDLGDVDLERQELVVRQGKGDRGRRLPVPEAVWTVLLAYLAERKGRRGALLRTVAKGVRLRPHEVCAVVSAAAGRAGLPGGVTPKTLRHSFATHLMDRGVDLAVIASLMGHRSAQETGVYLHRLPGRAEAAVALLQGERRSS
ncbi:MAG TPA: tyrosine-type recombinase/integrase [Verrucomicrobiota bacterium]|nr:tyrosine-type recombinase/integrase [Verrucomicrobiota bacterium]